MTFDVSCTDLREDLLGTCHVILGAVDDHEVAPVPDGLLVPG